MAAVEQRDQLEKVDQEKEEFYDFYGTESHKKHDMAKIARRNSMEALGPEEETGAREEFETLMLAKDRYGWRSRRSKLVSLGPEAQAGARRSMEAFFLAQQHLVGECAAIDAEYLAEVQLKHDEIFDTIDSPIRRASALRRTFEASTKSFGDLAANMGDDANGGDQQQRQGRREHPFSWSGPSAGVGGVGPLMRPTARMHPANRGRFRSAGLIMSEPVRRARNESSAAAVLAVLTDDVDVRHPSPNTRRDQELRAEEKGLMLDELSLEAKVALAAGVLTVGGFFAWRWLHYWE